jgi:hypothetical protein
MRGKHKVDGAPPARQSKRGMVAALAAVLSGVTAFVVIVLVGGPPATHKPTGAANNVAIGDRVSAARPSPTARPRASHAKPTAKATATAKAAAAPLPKPLTGCASDPHSCGYPDSASTGPRGALTNVPSQRTSGPGWVWQGDHIVVSTSGATVSGLNIDGWAEINANNVTLDNLNITSTGDGWGVGLYCQSQGCSGSVIENTSIGSPAATGANRLEVGIKDVYGNAVGTQIRRVNVYHASTAIQISNGVIADSYIHDFGYNAAEGDHLNGVSVGGGDSRPLLVQHNTILNNYDQTDAVALFQDFGSEVNKTISGNLLAGGSYSLYGGGPNGCTGPASAPKCDPSSNIVVTNNVFSTMFSPTGGGYGPVANFNPAGSGNVWSANKWADGHDAGKPISP